MIYLTIFILLLALSFHYDVGGNKKGKMYWYVAVLVILVCLAGMRYRIGVDTTRGIYAFYNETYSLSQTWNSLKITEYPLWKLLNSLVYSLGGRFYMIQFIESAFVNILLFLYIKKHSSYLFTCVLLYFIWVYPSYNFEEMKQSFAVALALHANDFVLEKKYLKSFALFAIGCLFHFATILIAFSSLLSFFLKLNKKVVVVFVFAFFLGGIIQNYYQDYLIIFGSEEFLRSKVESYLESERFGSISDRNLNYFFLHFLPIFFSVFAFVYTKKYSQNRHLLVLEPFLVLCMLYIVLGTRIVIVYRYVNFYLIYSILFIAQAFVDMVKLEKVNFALLKTIIPSVLFGFYIFTTYMGTSGGRNRYAKFYPYASIIDMRVDDDRERVFSFVNDGGQYYFPNNDEY